MEYKNNKILELQKEINQIEEEMLKAHNSGNTRKYNNLKNEQHILINKCKKLEVKISDLNKRENL